MLLTKGTWPYNASKAAIHHLTQTMAVSLAGKLITVNAIAPGVFPSDMTAFGLKTAKDTLIKEQPLGRLGNESDMAGIVIFLASKASAHLNGVIIPIDGGALLPSKL
jgi:NAD(P)-dependent dehydrogenase (short-subunit alcohol dehydrogenase family)